ncbi:MAG: SRPBCC family protein [Planctomycetota bacterium]
MAVIVSETIDAPIDQVFAVSTDIPSAAEFISGISGIEMLSDGPVGQGTKWRETRTMFGREASETMWIAEWNPPERYVVEARSRGMRYSTPITLESLTDGRTTITMSFEATPESFMAKIMMKVFSGMTQHVRTALQQDLTDLKAHCES